MRRIALITRDGVTAEYFEALLYEKATLTVLDGSRKIPDCDLVVIDVESLGEEVKIPSGIECLTMGRGETPDLKRPFTDRALIMRLLPEKESAVEPHLVPEELSLVAGNGEYRLSDTEYRLLAELFSADGSEVDCKILFDRVWEGKAYNVNLLRVTVSHLRQRLKNAEIAIVSTRGGYRLEF